MSFNPRVILLTSRIGTDGAGGTATYTNKAAGEYSVTWQSISDMTSGKGWKSAQPRNITFTGNVKAQGNFYLAVYTWSQRGENYVSNPLSIANVKYVRPNSCLTFEQILENYGTYNPCSQGQKMGTITSDGSSYEICTVNRGNGYIQNWSIRQNKRSSGTVTTANHYNTYTAHGMTHNPLSEAAYQIVSTEGFGSSGSADITVSSP